MTPARGPIADVLAGLRKDPLGMTGLVIVSLLIIVTLFAPVLAPHDPLEVDVYNRLQDPSWQHWLGTDQLGRDILSRVLLGGQVALKVALIAIVVSLSIGLLL
ncbi:MAG: ABC transporter permease, partial [Pseudomonadota bacterium]